MSGVRPRKCRELRQGELSAAFRLVMECAELWCDPDAWKSHLVQGLWRLTHAGPVIFEVQEYSAGIPGGRVALIANAGWDDGATPRGFDAAWACPPSQRGVPEALWRHVFDGLSTRGHAVADSAEMAHGDGWRDSPMVTRLWEPFGLLGGIADFRAAPRGGFISELSLNRVRRGPPIRDWQKKLLSLVHSYVAPLVGTRLAVQGQITPAQLSPRRRQVLDLLLEGLSEKEVAYRLQIAPPTVHQYIGDIYGVFQVSSRAELMAYFVKRRPRTK